MPQVTIYIRKEDLSKWGAIKDRPAFIHDAIRVQHQSITGSAYHAPAFVPSTKTSFEIHDKLIVCEHGNYRGQCLQKDCKFSRYAK